jgi:2-oxoglutarate ferredoxin oxidoreductase subunit alpha
MDIPLHEPTLERPVKKAAIEVPEAIVEIVSDSGEGAQKCGQSLGAISAKMGNGVWTVEIIPAEIQPPARSRAGASGIRVRMGSKKVTNMGDAAHLVVAFNEQVLFGRVDQKAYKPGTFLLIENKWATDPTEKRCGCVRSAHGTRVPKSGARCPQRQKYVGAGHAQLHLQPRYG